MRARRELAIMQASTLPRLCKCNLRDTALAAAALTSFMKSKATRMEWGVNLVLRVWGLSCLLFAVKELPLGFCCEEIIFFTINPEYCTLL